MGLKLNGATSGSIEIDVPAVAGTDTAITIPATTGGEFIVSDSSGNIDLGPLDIDGSASDDSVNIDSSGRLLVGLTSTSATESVVLQGNSSGATSYGSMLLARGTSSPSDGGSLGNIEWSDNTHARSAIIRAERDSGTWSGSSLPTRLSFLTTANGASSPTERVVIDSAGLLNLSTAAQKANFARSATFRVLSGTITQNATFEMGNTGFTNTQINIACERSGSNAYNFIELYSGRRYDNSSGDRETSLEGDGNNYCDGSWSGGGADYAEMFEWSDANPDAEDRRGISVVLDGDKIREAVAGEDPIGVISGNPSVVGDTAWNKWNEKYLTDDFGTYQRETYSLTEWQDENGDTQSYESDRIPADVTVPDDAVVKTVDDAGATLTRRILNPNYDPDVAYVPRKERAEWDAVGLMGKLRIRKGQVTGARWIKMRDVSDTVEEWLVR